MKRNSLNPDSLVHVISTLVGECEDQKRRRRSTIINDLMSTHQITNRKLCNLRKKSFSIVPKPILRRISSSINMDTLSSDLFKNVKMDDNILNSSKVTSKTLRVSLFVILLYNS